MKKRALGRGLSTLLPARGQQNEQHHGNQGYGSQTPAPVTPAIPTHLPIDEIRPNPFQPRRNFDEAALNELAQSIRADGVIQPLVVRKAEGVYQLIAGERRLRASKLAGLTSVPVHVQEMADNRMLEVALIENIQRENLNPIEESQAYQSLSEDLGLSQEEIGQRTGKDRATISNAIRLLQLPDDVQQLLISGKLTPGHGRALLKIGDAGIISEMARAIVSRELSVRAVEAMTKVPSASATPRKQETLLSDDPNVRTAMDELERVLGTKVRIFATGGTKGRLEIDFYSVDDLHRIYAAITGFTA